MIARRFSADDDIPLLALRSSSINAEDNAAAEEEEEEEEEDVKDELLSAVFPLTDSFNLSIFDSSSFLASLSHCFQHYTTSLFLGHSPNLELFARGSSSTHLY